MTNLPEKGENRSIVGLDMSAAMEAFAKYPNSSSMDSRQICFVNQIVGYVVRDGVMYGITEMSTIHINSKSRRLMPSGRERQISGRFAHNRDL